MNSVIEIGCILLLIAFAVLGMVFARRVDQVSTYIRRHHPVIIDEIRGLSIGARLGYLLDSVVFPRRRLKAELAAAGIEDPTLEALISSTSFYNRLAIALFAGVVLCAFVHRLDGWM